MCDTYMHADSPAVRTGELSKLVLFKHVHFILQDRVHHHVTGCCHPGNVSFTDFHLRIEARSAGRSEASSHEVATEDCTQFVFISMWPRFLAVQTQYGCSPWETTCCISEYCPSKALPKMLQRVELIQI